MRYQTPLANDELRAIAPSIFAAEPYHAMSARYAFIPTIQVVDKMRSEGFAPFSAVQSRTRIPGKQEFTKHQIRFRDIRNGENLALMNVGDVRTEIILTNSHDGASAYKVDAGLFRCVCTNQMCVADGEISRISVKHVGGRNAADDVIDATYEVVEEFPKVIDSVQRFQAMQLTAPEKVAFAEAALTLRYDEGESPVRAPQILTPRRREDADPTLWNTFNVVQEKLLKGGVRGQYNVAKGRRGSVRAVNGIDESTKLNKALWALTARMAELKGMAAA